ncbi:MAG: four helix bundle protein [Acidobacteriota bacterium]|nr:four helix bundle protein [Acidobacteriota bacterium]
MAKIKKFEDIESWKKARELTKQLYETTSTEQFTRDFGLKDQIRRAAVSILSALQFEALSPKAVEVGQLLSGFIKYLKQSDLRGNKYS